MSDISTWDIFRNLLMAARWTIALTLTAFIGGGIVGLLVLFARTSGNKALVLLTKGFIELFQGTPLLMQLFLAFFGLGLFGIDVPAWRPRTRARSKPPRAWRCPGRRFSAT